MSQAIDSVRIRPLSTRIGAEITGVDLSEGLSEDTVFRLRDAVLRHKVIFLRGQHHCDEAAQKAFAAQLGHPSPQHPIGQGNGDKFEGTFVFDSRFVRANVWHVDLSYVADYPAFSVLRSLIVPACGGDTVWTNTAAAYESLPGPLAALADGLWAVHDNTYGFGATTATRASSSEREFHRDYETVHFATEHPVVRVHPETGERTLLLGEFAHCFVGLPVEDSQTLHTLLQRYVTQLENTVRWRWEAGDVVVWDNRATQHVALDDYGDAPRQVNRITVDGEVPVSVDGRSSVIRVGADSPWYRRHGTPVAGEGGDPRIHQGVGTCTR